MDYGLDERINLPKNSKALAEKIDEDFDVYLHQLALCGHIWIAQIDSGERGIEYNMRPILNEYTGKRKMLAELEENICEFEKNDYIEGYLSFIDDGKIRIQRMFKDFYAFDTSRKIMRYDAHFVNELKHYFNKETQLPVKLMNRLEDVAISLAEKVDLDDYPTDYAEHMNWVYNKIVDFSLKNIKRVDYLDLSKDDELLKARARYVAYHDLVDIMKDYYAELHKAYSRNESKSEDLSL